MTDEELEAIKLEGICPICDGDTISVRRVSRRWWHVGCTCGYYYECERKYVLECVDKWNEWAKLIEEENK